jgi:tetratricopeptide (TPR) repeat protein
MLGLRPNVAHWIVVLCTAAAGVAHADSGSGSPDEVAGTSDSIEQLRRDEAAMAMHAGEYERARRMYLTVLRTRPDDAHARREAGRAAHALGLFELALDDLRRADELQGGRADPELHYLVGEALYALGRTDEARVAHARAAAELGDAPTGRMESLWRARIHARAGEHDRAEAIYSRLADGRATDSEVMLSWTEARIFAGDWDGAEQLLRARLRDDSEDERALDMLAWALEAQGKSDEERELRRSLVQERTPDDYVRIISQGRALERGGQFGAALASYRKAHAIDADGDEGLSAAIDRMRYRLTTEASVGGVMYVDPSGSSQELHTGVAFPIGSEFAVAVAASFGTASGDGTMREASGATVTAGLVAGFGRDLTSAMRVSGNYRDLSGEGLAPDDHAASIGAEVELRIGTGRPVQAHARAALHMPWREAANTIREGGVYDGATGTLYWLPAGHRLILQGGMRIRSMSLHPLMDGTEATGSQVMGFGGADFVAWSDPTSVARGQILDEEMLWPTYLADSLTFSYRHFEAQTDDDFGDRLVLAERDRIDEISAAARKAFGAGEFGLELRGGLGYDWAREARMWRAGGAVLVSPTRRSRISFLYDVANESTHGFVGRRHAGWLTLHVDI